MTTDRDDKIKDEMEIGVIAFPLDWLRKHNIPFQKKNLQRIKDSSGGTVGFRITIDQDRLPEDFKCKICEQRTKGDEKTFPIKPIQIIFEI